jgi:hypothetical protein
MFSEAESDGTRWSRAGQTFSNRFASFWAKSAFRNGFSRTAQHGSIPGASTKNDLFLAVIAIGAPPKAKTSAETLRRLRLAFDSRDEGSGGKT